MIWTGETGSKAKFENASTVADGKIYDQFLRGEVYVVKAGGDSFELLSMNEMGNGSKPNGDAASCRQHRRFASQLPLHPRPRINAVLRGLRCGGDSDTLLTSLLPGADASENGSVMITAH